MDNFEEETQEFDIDKAMALLDAELAELDNLINAHDETEAALQYLEMEEDIILELIDEGSPEAIEAAERRLDKLMED